MQVGQSTGLDARQQLLVEFGLQAGDRGFDIGHLLLGGLQQRPFQRDVSLEDSVWRSVADCGATCASCATTFRFLLSFAAADNSLLLASEGNTGGMEPRFDSPVNVGTLPGNGTSEPTIPLTTRPGARRSASVGPGRLA